MIKSHEEAYVLVTGHHPAYCIQGWMIGKFAKVDKFIRDPNRKYAAWFVPIKELRPMDELPVGAVN